VLKVSFFKKTKQNQKQQMLSKHLICSPDLVMVTFFFSVSKVFEQKAISTL